MNDIVALLACLDPGITTTPFDLRLTSYSILRSNAAKLLPQDLEDLINRVKEVILSLYHRTQTQTTGHYETYSARLRELMWVEDGEYEEWAPDLKGIEKWLNSMPASLKDHLKDQWIYTQRDEVLRPTS